MFDVERIRKYNLELRTRKEERHKLEAELKYSKEVLERLCAELSSELEVTVTPDNLEEIYQLCVQKIQDTLTSGERILNRINEISI